jgi:translation initiation factor IF-3
MDTRSALQLAESQGLDLAEVSPTANPPVCKILDYGKYKYQLKKKQKTSKKNQVVILLKEVQFRPQTDSHDVDFKVKHILRFLEDGHKVKASVRFRGRESAHSDLGYALLKQIIDMVGISGIVEQPPKMEGKVLSLIFAAPQKGKKAAPKPEAKLETATKPPAGAVAKETKTGSSPSTPPESR